MIYRMEYSTDKNRIIKINSLLSMKRETAINIREVNTSLLNIFPQHTVSYHDTIYNLVNQYEFGTVPYMFIFDSPLNMVKESFIDFLERMDEAMHNTCLIYWFDKHISFQHKAQDILFGP